MFYFREVMSGLSLGFEVLGNIISEITDEVYYKIIYGIEDLVDYLRISYAKVVRKMSIRISKMKEGARKFLYASAKNFEKYWQYISRKAQNLSERLVVRADRLFRAYAPFIIDGYYYIKNAADSIRNSFNSKFFFFKILNS